MIETINMYEEHSLAGRSSEKMLEELPVERD